MRPQQRGHRMELEDRDTQWGTPGHPAATGKNGPAGPGGGSITELPPGPSSSFRPSPGRPRAGAASSHQAAASQHHPQHYPSPRGRPSAGQPVLGSHRTGTGAEQRLPARG